MKNLKKSLDLPKIGGLIIVSYSSRPIKPFQRVLNQIFQSSKSQEKGVFEWKVEFIFPGPDGRYNPGVAFLSEHSIKYFIKDMKEALQKMLVLEKQSFSGVYSQLFTGQFHFFNYPAIEVKAEDGKVWLSFYVSSGTYNFSRSLSSGEVSTIIDKLQEVEAQAKNMIKTLSALV